MDRLPHQIVNGIVSETGNNYINHYFYRNPALFTLNCSNVDKCTYVTTIFISRVDYTVLLFELDFDFYFLSYHIHWWNCNLWLMTIIILGECNRVMLQLISFLYLELSMLWVHTYLPIHLYCILSFIFKFIFFRKWDKSPCIYKILYLHAVNKTDVVKMEN